MAAVEAARRLTEAHRVAQARLGAQTILSMRRIWPLLDIDDLDGTFERWLRTAEPLIQAQRSTSATLAANYLATFRTIELGVDAGSVTPALASPVETAVLETSLLVTGPARIRSALARGVPLVRALTNAETAAASAAMRHALNGGRSTIVDTVAEDRKALGWARATSGRACPFCAMLASRGPAYKSDETADFRAHDHCGCAVEPVYRHDAAWPASSRRYAALWRQAKDADGDTTSNFRRLVAA